MIKFIKNCFPDFIIIGAQKGGTSALHFYLSQHPDIEGSLPKELHYFDIEKYKGKDLNWYKCHFKKTWFSSKKIFEATPSYIYNESIAKELHNIKPDVKLIICLRNPIDRAYSAWNMYKLIFDKNKGEIFKNEDLYLSIYDALYKGRVNFPSFEEAIKIEEELFSTDNLEPAILRRGLYYEQIKSYLKYFKLNDIKLIDSNDLKLNTMNEINSVCEFIGVKPFKKSQVNLKKVHKLSYADKMNNETRKKLNLFYKDSNENLFKLINRDLNWK